MDNVEDVSENISKKKILIIAISGFVALLLIAIGTRQGLQNKVDPFWNYLDSLLIGNNIFDSSKSEKNNLSSYKKYKIYTLKDKMDSASSFYYSIHQKSEDIDNPIELLSNPFLPNWEYDKLINYLKPLLTKKRIVLSGVTGAGKSTIVDRLAKFISGSPKRIKQLLCTERMETQYHREWIGEWTQGGFIKGKLLDYLEKAIVDPNHNYVFILDDFDKIYPSAFFGSELWNELDNPQDVNTIDGYGEVRFPDNFYFIAVTHVGVANVIELNDEHFRRLGTPYPINADFKEFLLYIIERIEKKKVELSFQQAKKIVYFFYKANAIIEEKYGKDNTLGQWSTLKSYIKPEDFNKFAEAFLTHVNSFKPQKELTLEDFEPIYYTFETNGLLAKTNFIYSIYLAMVSTGIFSELSVALGFALISGLFGWLFLRKKKKLLEKFQFDVISISENYRDNKIEFEKAMQMMVAKKQHLEELILQKKIKYEEITFLLLFIDDQLKKIEEYNKTNSVAKEFYKTIDDFMKDGILDEDEFNILVKFLENLKSALSPEIYYTLKNKIESLRNQNITF